MTRNQAIVLRAAALWTFYVWITRIWNIVEDSSTSTAFKAVHSILAVVSIAFAIAILVVVSKNRRGVKV
ncbi:MAG TPA: hypothetical protein VFV09_13935 [Actinomycetota bacterium]|jgi:uncharacterized membrane protein|nr:hypothetical protein [Actinomycetota bacterium]